ncbi:beta-N-acetylhexosaminidase [Glaciimonas sp. PCH181]|uniref:beta-N-acetylhexosaminidase n=1 Tax=Glaciimonas sp. PCH181 TaxID=2133943 RepID=UPI000D3A7D99|nr:beta-N-acetylhexosaminidase [Glaciimonas sp. PCH181]PUA20809.1 beta-N-acetylhexosaminidase [Glaciimonas sp. PCH181]
MLDVVGTTLTDEDIRRIQHPLTGGIILFTRNFQDRAQLTALTAAIRAARPNILIAVDHEGGRVQRFRTDGFTRLPAMRLLGNLWDSDVLASTKAATAVGFVLAMELRACGIDLSFTPVLDLDFGGSTVIGERAFHRDPRVVTLLAKSLSHGLKLAGMANCGKHFPGHGFVEGDSHLSIPLDLRTLQQIMDEDVKPYDWLGMSLSAVMPAHVIYPEVDKHSAGFSKKWLTILREEIGFNGVIFSDDLSMAGASSAGTVLDGANAALAAGCDVVMICNSPDKADQLLSGLTIPNSASADTSAARLAALMPQSAAPDWEALQKNADYLAAKKIVATLIVA